MQSLFWYIEKMNTNVVFLEDSSARRDDVNHQNKWMRNNEIVENFLYPQHFELITFLNISGSNFYEIVLEFRGV